jgi:hypothetical protein
MLICCQARYYKDLPVCAYLHTLTSTIHLVVCCRYGTLQDILGAVQSAEGPPPALRHQLQQLWGNLSSAAAALEAAQQRLPVVQLHPGPQHLPAAVGAAYAAAASSARQVIAAGGSPAAAAQQQALMHPPQRHRRAQCVPYRRLLREALARLGLDHYQVRGAGSLHVAGLVMHCDLYLASHQLGVQRHTSGCCSQLPAGVASTIICVASGDTAPKLHVEGESATTMQ